MAIQPIRLFGDPVLRTPRRPGRRLRQGAAHAGRRTSPTPCWTRPAPAWPRRRSASGCGSSPGTSTARSATWSTRSSTLSEEIQDGPEGCLSIPGLTFDCRRALSVVATGFNMHGEPVTIEGSELLARAIQHETDHLDGMLFIDRLDPETRKAAMKAIREAEWFGARAAARSRSARTRPTGSGSDAASSSPAPPRSPLPALEAVAASRPRAGRRGHPSRRAGRAAAASWSPRPVAQRAEELGVPVLKPDHPRDPEFQAALRELAPDCCPVVAYGALLPQAALDIPRARLGQPALLGAARLARRRAGAARDLGRRRGHRRDHVPDRQGARRRPDVRRDDRADPARPTPPATCSAGSPRAAPGCWSPPSTASRTAPSRRASSRPTGSASPRRSPSRTPRSTGPSRRVAVDRRIRACTPGAGRLDDVRGRAGQARPGHARRRRTSRSPPGELDGRPRTPSTSAPAPVAGAARPGEGVRARSRWPPPTGPAACGSSPAPGCG